MLAKDYTEAIKSFSMSLKCNPTHKDARYYRAISSLDSGNTNKCISDLNELIQMDPMYNKTNYIVLAIAYRR
jgi:tetratricopeptide (TPR) repeat protein